MATTIETVQVSYINFTNIVKFKEAVDKLGLKLVIEQPRYAETNAVVDITDFKKVFNKSFMRQLAYEGSKQFILAYIGE